MKHKLKQSIIVPALAALSLTLAACGENETHQTPAADTSGPTHTSGSATASGAANGTDYLAMVSTEVASEKGFVLGGVSMGNPDAPVTIVEYASLTCGHCAHFDEEILPTIKERYIASGKVRYVLYNFLLNRVDIAASSITRCFGEEKFFPLTELFFARQKEWLANARDQKQLIDDMATVARRGGVSRTQFDQCLAERDLQQHLVEMATTGQERWDITGTPTIIVNDKKRGAEAMNLEGLITIIEDEL